MDQAVVGQYDRREGDKQTIKIGAKFIHPDYDNPDRDNDIALLRLDTPAVLGDAASPPCLPKGCHKKSHQLMCCSFLDF